MRTRAELESAIYDALISFNVLACWSILRHAEHRRYLAEHLAAVLDTEEKASAPAAPTATPHVFIEDARIRALHDAMNARPGHQWRTGDVCRVLRDAGHRGIGRTAASRFLRALVNRGLAEAHGPDDGRYYTLTTSKGGCP